MSNSIKKAIEHLFDDVARNKSAMKKLLNPSVGGAGSRVIPARNEKNDVKYGIRIDKGEPVAGKANILRLHLQINSNAQSKTLRDLAKKDPHKVIAIADVDTSQEVDQKNLDKIEEQFLDSVDI
jgi:hypothetical protein